jgi:hypothetical protein
MISTTSRAGVGGDPAYLAPARAVIVLRWRGYAIYFTLATFSGRAAASPPRATDGSNPSPSTGESVANPTFRKFQALLCFRRSLLRSGLTEGRRNARHAAMASFPTQPPQEPPLQQFGVEPVGLCPAIRRHSRDGSRAPPPPAHSANRQPEAVAAGFEGQRNPGDSAAGPDRLIPTAM